MAVQLARAQAPGVGDRDGAVRGRGARPPDQGPGPARGRARRRRCWSRWPPTGPSSGRTAIASSLQAGGRSSSRSSCSCVGVFGFVSLLTQRDFVTPDLSFGGMLEATYGGLIGQDGPYTFEHKVFADFFSDALLVARDRRAADLPLPRLPAARPDRAPEREAPRARRARSCARYGSDTLAYFALRRDKSYFFSADGRSRDRLRLRARLRDGRRRPDRPARGHRRGRSTSSSPSATRRAGGVAFLAVREDATPRLPRPRHALPLPRRRGDPPLRRVQPRRRRDEGGPRRGQPRRARPTTSS